MQNNTAVNTVTVDVNNASKKDATILADLVVQHRNEKRSATRIVSKLNSDLGDGLIAGSFTVDEIQALVADAKKAFSDAMDVVQKRALSLRQIPRGATGPGGIHRDDAVTEIFAAAKKSAAVERNTSALKKAGKI